MAELKYYDIILQPVVTEKSMNEMLDRLISDKDLLIHLNKQIVKLKERGIYNGGYEAVKLAVKGK